MTNETQQRNADTFNQFCKILGVTPDPRYADNCWRGCFEYEGQQFVVSWQSGKKFEIIACRPDLRGITNSYHLERKWDDEINSTINESATKDVNKIVAGFKRRFDFKAFADFRAELGKATDSHNDSLRQHHELLDKMSKITGFPIVGKYDHNTKLSPVDRKSMSNELRTSYFGNIKLQYQSAEFKLSSKNPETIALICQFIADNADRLE